VGGGSSYNHLPRTRCEKWGNRKKVIGYYRRKESVKQPWSIISIWGEGVRAQLEHCQGGRRRSSLLPEEQARQKATVKRGFQEPGRGEVMLGKKRSGRKEIGSQRREELPGGRRKAAYRRRGENRSAIETGRGVKPLTVLRHCRSRLRVARDWKGG